MPDLICPSRNRFPPGEGTAWSRPGDFILVTGTSWKSKVTSAYQWGRARGPEQRQCARWNHAALVAGAGGAIVEAGTAGVVLQHLDKYRGEDYFYVAVGATLAQRLRAVRFAVSRIGSPYDDLAIAGIVLSALTRGRLRFKESQHDLCGSLVARALACAGERFELRPSAMTPADLAAHYGVAEPSTAFWPATRGDELSSALYADDLRPAEEPAEPVLPGDLGARARPPEAEDGDFAMPMRLAVKTWPS